MSVRRAVFLACSLFCVVLAGCQSPPVEALNTEATPPAPAPQNAPPADAGKQLVGSGPVGLALFVDTVGAPVSAADQRDGAALAIKQLGDDRITLSVFDLLGDWERLDGRVQEAVAGGASLLIGPADIASTPAWAKSAKRPPILAQTVPSVSAPGLYTLTSDEIDSAIGSAAYAAANNHGSVLVVSRTALSPSDQERLRQGMEARGAKLIGPLVMPPAASEADRAAIADASAVMVLGPAPAPMLAAARDSGLPRDAWILGTSEWKPGNMAEGAFVAAVDRSNLPQISQAFRMAYGRPLSAEAAFAYDSVAVAAGIVRSKGPGGLAASSLEATAGFVGATGSFRFLNDGRVERHLSVYRVTSGALKEHEQAPRQF